MLAALASLVVLAPARAFFAAAPGEGTAGSAAVRRASSLQGLGSTGLTRATARRHGGGGVTRLSMSAETALEQKGLVTVYHKETCPYCKKVWRWTGDRTWNIDTVGVVTLFRWRDVTRFGCVALVNMSYDYVTGRALRHVDACLLHGTNHVRRSRQVVRCASCASVPFSMAWSFEKEGLSLLLVCWFCSVVFRARDVVLFYHDAAVGVAWPRLLYLVYSSTRSLHNISYDAR